jgi:hypothetical protein
MLVAIYFERGQGGRVEEIGEMGFAVLIEIPFREGDGFGVVPIVEADPETVGSRVAGDLHEPDSRRIENLLHIVAYLVDLALI